jgi:hypothetical protein
VALPVMALLALPFVNRRTIEQALVAVEAEDAARPATDGSR